MTNAIYVSDHCDCRDFILQYKAEIVDSLCFVLQKDELPSHRLILEVLQALSKLLSLDERYPNTFAGEDSVANMVDQCEGDVAIDVLTRSDVNQEIKEEA